MNDKYSLEEHKVIRRNSAFVLRHIDTVNLLVACKKNTLNHSLISLNTTATAVWNEANGIEKEDLLNILAFKFNLNPRSNQMKELDDFINYLLSIDVLIGEDRNVNV